MSNYSNTQIGIKYEDGKKIASNVDEIEILPSEYQAGSNADRDENRDKPDNNENRNNNNSQS